jgi:hypothetical protein
MSKVELQESNDQFEQQRIELAAILGLDAPVAPEVLKKAVVDPDYAYDLLVSRRSPEMLALVLRKASKPNKKAKDEPELSTIDLVKSAAKSLAVWAQTGFSTVDDDQYRQRLQACSECEHLRAVPTEKSMLYRLTGIRIDEDAICGMCGCPVKLKARRTSENCPQPQLDQSGFSKWNEPINS